MFGTTKVLVIAVCFFFFFTGKTILYMDKVLPSYLHWFMFSGLRVVKTLMEMHGLFSS